MFLLRNTYNNIINRLDENDCHEEFMIQFANGYNRLREFLIDNQRIMDQYSINDLIDSDPIRHRDMIETYVKAVEHFTYLMLFYEKVIKCNPNPDYQRTLNQQTRFLRDNLRDNLRDLNDITITDNKVVLDYIFEEFKKEIGYYYLFLNTNTDGYNLLDTRNIKPLKLMTLMMILNKMLTNKKNITIKNFLLQIKKLKIM